MVTIGRRRRCAAQWTTPPKRYVNLEALVEPFQPPNMSELVDLFFQLTSADGGADAVRVLGDSPRDWRLRRMLLLCRLPRFARRGLAALLQALGQRRTAQVSAHHGTLVHR